MKKVFYGALIAVVTVAAVLVMLVEPTHASGGKERGAKGVGAVEQNGECPFGEDTPPVDGPRK